MNNNRIIKEEKFNECATRYIIQVPERYNFEVWIKRCDSNLDFKNSLMNLWYKNKCVTKLYKNYLTVDTYFTDKEDEICRSKANPTITKDWKINFDYIGEDSPELREKIINDSITLIDNYIKDVN